MQSCVHPQNKKTANVHLKMSKCTKIVDKEDKYAHATFPFMMSCLTADQ